MQTDFCTKNRFINKLNHSQRKDITAQLQADIYLHFIKIETP